MDTSPQSPRMPGSPRRLHLPRGHRLRELLSVRLNGFAASLVADVAVALLFLPPVAFVLAGLWGLIAYARALYAAWHVLTHWQLDAFFARLSAVDFAARVGLSGGAYVALLLALIVVFAGLLGRGHRRLFLLPGVVLAAPAAALFLFAAEATHEEVAARLHLPAALAPLFTAYALLDAVVLAALLLDLRPRRRRRRASRPLRAAPATRPIPRLEALPAPDQPAASSLALSTLSGSPPAILEASSEEEETSGVHGCEPAAQDGPPPGLTA